MKFTIVLIAVLPFVLGAKELLGEELPSKDISDEANIGGDDKEMVKRSITNIAARRRSALDKNFMRFGRSDPAMLSDNPSRISRSKDLIRFGRAKAQNVMRFGRSPSNFMRFGRSPSNFMRFGRARDNLMRFGRARDNLMRFGRARDNLMRFGRARDNLMRFGRSAADEGEYDDEDLMEYLRKASENEDQDRTAVTGKSSYYDDGFMRFGRITTDNPLIEEADEEQQQQQQDPFEVLFPDEDNQRQKRSTGSGNGVQGDESEQSNQRRLLFASDDPTST